MTDTDRPEAIDEATFAAIWSEHAGRIEGWLRPRVGADLAEDLTQDVFLKAWRIRAQYDPMRGPVIAWLQTIAGSVAADHFRATSRRPSTVDLPEGADFADELDVADSVCDRAEAADLLAQVPARDRELLARRYAHDQPVNTVADALAMPAGTVKARCHKALAALRTALGVVVPLTPRIPEPTPAQPVTAPAARSTVAHPRPDRGTGSARRHRPDPRRPRHPGAGRRPAHPLGSPRHPRLVHPVAGRGAGAPAVRAVPAGADPLRRRLRPQPRRHHPVPACPHRRQGGSEVMSITYDQYASALLPWIIAVAFMFLAITWALIVDDGKRASRRRDAAQAMERFGWTRYTQGRSSAATQTAVIDLAQMPTAFLPRFAPEPLSPGPDSPLTTVEIGDPEPAEEPVAPAVRWPVPELLPQPTPEPVEAVLYAATGVHPVLDPAVMRTGYTGPVPKLTDQLLAELDAAWKAGAR